MTTPPLSPLPRSLPQSLPDSIPTLTTHIATTPEDKIAALRLVADSVAQQRQLASRALISHPLPVAFAFLLLGILAQYLAWPIMFTTSAGVVMALLVAVRGATGGYLVAAEKVGWAWLQETGNGDDPDDEVRGKGKGADETVVLVTVWGKEIIGTVVVKMLKKERKALVRAWTVRLRFRGKGVGKSLLEEAVRLAIVDKGSRGVEFDKGHASEWMISVYVFRSRISVSISSFRKNHTVNFPCCNYTFSLSLSHRSSEKKSAQFIPPLPSCPSFPPPKPFS